MMMFFSVLIVVLVGFIAYRVVTQMSPAQLLESEFVKEIVLEQIGEEHEDIFDALPVFLGFDEPKTYLVLSLNNTELRPGGGFIGVYGVIKVDEGRVNIIKMEGTETLDNAAPKSWKQVPPTPLTEYLGVDRWWFRDSNWSPDFAVSSQKSLELYIGEQGVAADEIDAVVAITPTVLEYVLQVMGPVEVQGMTFTSENITETLEYEVEYGYADKGISFANRKQIIQPLMLAIMNHVKTDMFSRPKEYVAVFQDLIAEKHILMYTENEMLQGVGEKYQLSGTVNPCVVDCLTWVDANLAALKTDHALERSVTYKIQKNVEGQFVGTATMEYRHGGSFDWRTTRYLTYARVFVPKGATLVGIDGKKGSGQDIDLTEVDTGTELGRTWFGTYFAIEPGQSKTLSYSYILPDIVRQSMMDGSYTIDTQKQLGSIGHDLVLDLDFGSPVTGAEPAESKDEWGDNMYRYRTDLSVDRYFEVNF